VAILFDDKDCVKKILRRRWSKDVDVATRAQDKENWLEEIKESEFNR